MGYVKDIIDKLLHIQGLFYPEVEEYFSMGAGKVSLLRVVGVDGESVLLRCDGRKLEYAKGDETPVHIFKCTSDTFLSILAGEETMRAAVTENHFVIENASTGSIDLVECEKWARAFSSLGGLMRNYVGALK